MSSTQTSNFRGTLLALTPQGARGVLQDAATAAGLDLTWTAGLTELLERLASQPWSATFLSLSVDPVDEDVAERVGAEPRSHPQIAPERRESEGYGEK